MQTSHGDPLWPVIGIDLGTTNSCVGIWQHGRVEIIKNDQDKRTTPSWVAFTDTERLIGEAAVNQGRTNSTNTIFAAKRFIGRRFDDKMVQNDMKLLPFKVIAGPVNTKEARFLRERNSTGAQVKVTYMGKEKQLSGEEISAMVLVKMKDIAEAYLGSSVKNAVISVPAYFNNSQRQATKDAAAIAGLNVIRLINEPSAAAIAYGFDKQMSGNDSSKKNVLVLDLGGGTFDVSLISVGNDIFEVMAVGGDTSIGGCDFDSSMVRHFVQEFGTEHHIDVSQSPKALGRLRAACEKAKKELSLVAQTSIEIDSLSDGIDFNSAISRSKFEELNVELFEKCIELVEQCLSDACIDKSDVDDIVLVGGSTRIPKFQELLENFFDGKELSKSINADEAVAYGAAVHAAVLCRKINDRGIHLVDVTPLSLGLGEFPRPGLVDCVIWRNTVIPTTEKRSYIIDRQIIYISLYEGDKEQTKDKKPSAFIELSGNYQTQWYPSGIEMDIFYNIDDNGIFNISAKYKYSYDKIVVTNLSRLTETEIGRMRDDEQDYKVQERKYKEKVKSKNTLEYRVNEMKEWLTNGIDRVEEIQKWIDLNSGEVLDQASYEQKLEEVKAITKPFIDFHHELNKLFTKPTISIPASPAGSWFPPWN